MKAIGYLLRLRCSERRSFGIKAATISRNRHDFGMVFEPFREAVSGPVRKEIDNVAEVHIDQNRSILLAFAPSPRRRTKKHSTQHTGSLLMNPFGDKKSGKDDSAGHEATSS